MKHFAIILLMTGIMSSIFGTFIINRTITIDEVTLAAMRGASVPGSSLFDPYINDLSDANCIDFTDDASSGFNRVVPVIVERMYNATSQPSMLNEALFTEYLNSSYFENILTELAFNHATALEYFRNSSDSAYQRALDLTYTTINAAMLYDCLYYAPRDNVPDSVKVKLRDILTTCVRLGRETIASYDSMATVANREWGVGIPENYALPSFSIIQYRLQMLGAMGLAALLLRETVPSLYDEMSNDHLDYVEDMLLRELIPYTFATDKQSQGMLAFHTTNSGAYFESLGYQGQLLQMLFPFFTAYKRLTSDGVNYYNNESIVSWINDLTRKVTPTEADWPYNDDWGERATNPSPIIF